MRGLSDISGGASWTEAIPAAAVLSAFTLVYGMGAWALLKRRLMK
jgi:hypothetical protein